MVLNHSNISEKYTVFGSVWKGEKKRTIK